MASFHMRPPPFHSETSPYKTHLPLPRNPNLQHQQPHSFTEQYSHHQQQLMDSSSLSSLLGMPRRNPVQVSPEEFNLFHNIDRKLFTRLVFHLRRDRAESTKVMALWMHMERIGKEFNLVYNALTTLSDAVLNEMAVESVLALNCLQSEQFPFPSLNTTPDIPILQSMSKTDVSLIFFHENRHSVIAGVNKMLTDVCSRAFQDLWLLAEPIRQPQQIIPEPVAQNINRLVNNNNQINESVIEIMNRQQQPPVHNFFYENNNAAILPTAAATAFEIAGGSASAFPNNPYGGNVVQYGSPQQFWVASMMNPASVGTSSSAAPPPNLGGAPFDPLDLEFRRQIINDEMEGLLSRLHLHDDDDAAADGEHGIHSSIDHREDQVSANDRTIFLTFSKGYPISENELRNFFTRRFGDIIEGIYMQEVAVTEQPLYARLVLHAASLIPIVLNYKSKAKFSISGKHVWARKYVPKNAEDQPNSPRDGAANHSLIN